MCLKNYNLGSGGAQEYISQIPQEPETVDLTAEVEAEEAYLPVGGGGAMGDPILRSRGGAEAADMAQRKRGIFSHARIRSL